MQKDAQIKCYLIFRQHRTQYSLGWLENYVVDQQGLPQPLGVNEETSHQTQVWYATGLSIRSSAFNHV